MGDDELYGKTTESLDSLTDPTCSAKFKAWAPRSPTRTGKKDVPSNPDVELANLQSKNDNKDFDE